ncbi:hypothetical protein AVEN_171345-1 [Araneus ventricosus]|uniref:Uncharacterized protein n=1 Tax=Araneus ventricosus TaxID=182803 RepID=A0A4Y2KGM8_ARAVE|nr:hypothetical protein AVEN_171345-1 [Araneus ventricosus]
MFSGRTLRFLYGILFGRTRDTHSEALIQRHFWKAYRRVKPSGERLKTRFDSRATDHHFNEGDLVWMYNPKRRRGLSPKLQQNWEGPYTIVKKQKDVK